MKKANRLTCCDKMQEAQRPGSDSEGYGKLVHGYNEGEYSIGGIGFFDFCPFCGEPVKGADDDNPEQ